MLICLYIMLKSTNYALNLIIFMATISNSFILFGKYPVFDELLAIWILVIFILSLLFQKNRKYFSSIFNFKIELVLLFYLLTNTLSSFVMNEKVDFSNLRFINIYIILLILLFISCTFVYFNYDSFTFLKIGALFYLYLWTFYWFILKILNIDWNEQQSVVWSGSVGASFIPAFASILVLKDFFAKSTFKKNLTLPFQIIILSTLCAFLYESRILQAICFFVISLLLFANFKFKALLMSFSFILLLTLPLALNFDRVKIEGIKTVTLNWYSNQIASSMFIINTRESDSDRERQLQCINSIILQNENLAKVLFGYGQNNHKQVLFNCKEIKDTLRSDLEYVRPVGLTSFAVDFGLVGLVLLISVFLKKSFILYLNKDYISILALSILPIYLLLTNAWDIIIFNIILFTDFLLRQSKSCSSQNSR